MAELCIQIHPHRAVGFDVTDVRSFCEALANREALVRSFAFVDGTDEHYYANLMFETDHLHKLWSLLQRQLYQSHAFGEAMQQCSMAVCEGRHGWDDYLLLRHYDATVQCDRFPEDDASPSA